MPKKKQNEEDPWKNSKAKKLLTQDLISGEIPLDSDDMQPMIVYHQRPEFIDFEYTRFRDRLRELRNQIIEKTARAASDSAAHARDRQIYPKPTHNHRGEPRWEGSEAERLLRVDMDENKHKNMKPMELYNTREEYYDNYKLVVFRKHIDQEERCRKFLVYWAKKNMNS
jgi:hypothetical protein